MHELFLFALDAAGRFFPKSSNPHPQCAKKVLSPGAGGFCYSAIEFCSWLARWASKVFLQFK